MPALQFWKPGTAGPGSTLDREAESEGSLLPGPSNSSASLLSISAQRTRLPIYKHREKLLYCVEKYGVTIVVGQTGCGKSTRESFSSRSRLVLTHFRATSIPARERMGSREQGRCMYAAETSRGDIRGRSSSRGDGIGTG